MTDREMLELAAKAGFSIGDGIVTGGSSDLERFAALIAAAEREECAALVASWNTAMTDKLAAAIRARGAA